MNFYISLLSIIIIYFNNAIHSQISIYTSSYLKNGTIKRYFLLYNEIIIKVTDILKSAESYF